jgi:hypothetical protein
MSLDQKARNAASRADALENARRVLQQIVSGSLDTYEGYRQLYGYYATSGLVEELGPFFRLAGIDPNGSIHVDDQFRATVRQLAEEWLGREWPSSCAIADEVFEKVGAFGVRSSHDYRVGFEQRRGVVYGDADGEATIGYSWLVNGMSLHPRTLRPDGLAQARVEKILARTVRALHQLGYSVELF